MTQISRIRASFVMAAIVGAAALTLSASAQAAPQVSGCMGGALVNGAWPKDRDLCVSGTLHQGEHIRFHWTQTSASALRPSMFQLKGGDGAVTALDVYAENGKTPVYSLVDGGTGEGINDTVFLAAGHYVVELSCGQACTGGGDRFHLESMMMAAGDAPEYQTEKEPNDSWQAAQVLPDVFALDGSLGDSLDNYIWVVPKRDASTSCWQVQIILPVNAHGWVKLYDPDGALLAEADADARSHGRTSIRHLGLVAGRYRLRIGPARAEAVPYRLNIYPAGPRDLAAGRGLTANGCQTQINDN
jgi:hypothetical protein